MSGVQPVFVWWSTLELCFRSSSTTPTWPKKKSTTLHRVVYINWPSVTPSEKIIKIENDQKTVLKLVKTKV
jgi:hypothetical protein